jgi:transposase, IS5 family
VWEEFVMLVCRNPQPTSLLESLLPEPYLDLPVELAAVDRLLDDPAFFAPFRAHFHAVLGRPSIPMETYLRMMFLKYRYRLSYEDLCREVGDSISWTRFCRIPLGGRVPHPTTLMKITTRCGEDTVQQLNDTLLAKAHGEHVVKLDKVRADTTVVEANVRYPTDSGLLAHGIALMVTLVARVHAAGAATRPRVRDRRRAAGRRARSIMANLKRRNDDTKAAVLRITGELADLAGTTATEAEQVVRNARRKLRAAGTDASGKLAALTDQLEAIIDRTRRVAAQTHQRLSGDTPDGATRIVSLHDADARPIRKGRLGKPIEFGYKAQVVDNRDGIVIDHSIHLGNPRDDGLLVPAIRRILARFGRVPRAVTADRGYSDATVEGDLTDLGVTTVVIPRKGKPSAARRAHEQRPSFRRLVKWRTGSEGRISHLKRGYGWGRTLQDGIDGAQTWCGWGILAHNSIKISRLIDAREHQAVTARQRAP